MVNTNFSRLLEPGNIGRVRTKNRIVKTAQGSSVIEPDTGFCGERALAYYENLVKGGVGLLIVESCGVEYPLGTHHPPVQFRLHDDSLIPSFSKLAAVAHRYNTPVFIQLIHSGPWNPTGLRNLSNARCSSTLTKEQLPGPDFVETQAMTLEEVSQVQDMFIKAAERAYKAGFDGVEINAATCTLPNSFLSRVFNRRTDQYGEENLENRARFVVEIIQGIRRQMDPGFVVTVIINAAEYGHPRATPLSEGVQFARIFQDAGAEAVQIRCHYYGRRHGLMYPDRFYYPELPAGVPRDLDWSNNGKGAYLPLAVAVKAAGVTVPVISAARLDPVLGEQALREGKIDFVGMTRRILADPELPRKVMEGRLEDIRPCLGCLYCMDVRLENKYVMCRVNPQINREREISYEPAKKKKKVLIIGGGPAGMEAARVAATRGHDVFLYDKQPGLGGLIPRAALIKDVEADDLTALVKWFTRQLNHLGVKIKLGTEVTPSIIKRLKPDAVIIATGGKHNIPDIPGFAAARVTTSAHLHRRMKFFLRFFSSQTLARLTRLWMPVGRRVIIIGGKIHGCETAEFLAKRGRDVTIVDGEDKLGEGLSLDDKQLLFPWFERKKVKYFLGVKYNSLTKGKLNITTSEGQNLTIEADTIMSALPLSPDNDIINKFKDIAPEVYFIGDCADPGLLAEATSSGALTASKL